MAYIINVVTALAWGWWLVEGIDAVRNPGLGNFNSPVGIAVFIVIPSVGVLLSLVGLGLTTRGKEEIAARLGFTNLAVFSVLVFFVFTIFLI